MTSEIICRMFSLTEAKDVEPYLPAIMPGLKESILDPLPEVRSALKVVNLKTLRFFSGALCFCQGDGRSREKHGRK